MDIPFFFSDLLTAQTKQLALDETGSKHAVQVLRMKEGEQVQLANGKGIIAQAIIAVAHKKKAELEITSVRVEAPLLVKNSIAISLVKNAARFEWFLEKATEIGISEIIPLICHRTERQLFKEERLKQILISAMLQSKQSWMPALRQPVKFADHIAAMQNFSGQKFIAHCEETSKQELTTQLDSTSNHSILIGPEGDFTNDEINLAISCGFLPAALGNTRLRTETAGMVAATLMKII